jgi:arylsulfatase A-like enzyme
LELETFAEIFRANGYRTAGFVTNPYLKKEFQFDQGFEVYEVAKIEKALRARVRAQTEDGIVETVMYVPAPDPTRGRAETITQRASEWIRTIRGDSFFLYIHFMDVHYPYLPPAEYREAFDYARVPGKSDPEIQQPWLEEKGLNTAETAKFAEHMRGLYDGELSYTDEWIGFLLRQLEETDGLENTIVIITADHGEEFLEHGGTIHKGKMYEELVRVPLIVRVPGRPGGTVNAVVRNFDILPTVLDYCGIEPNNSALDARSLRPLIDGKPGACAR